MRRRVTHCATSLPTTAHNDMRAFNARARTPGARFPSGAASPAANTSVRPGRSSSAAAWPGSRCSTRSYSGCTGAIAQRSERGHAAPVGPAVLGAGYFAHAYQVDEVGALHAFPLVCVVRCVAHAIGGWRMRRAGLPCPAGNGYKPKCNPALTQQSRAASLSGAQHACHRKPRTGAGALRRPTAGVRRPRYGGAMPAPPGVRGKGGSHGLSAARHVR